MSVKRELVTVGFDKNGEFDFGITMSVSNLTFDEMQKLRQMVCVAIGQMEDIWRRHGPNSRDPSMQAKSAPKSEA